jgi:hypothetical protein
MKHKKRPTHDEIAVFYYNRYVEAGKRSTLPFLTESWIDGLLKEYELVFPENLSIKEIICLLKESRVIEKRREIEHSI